MTPKNVTGYMQTMFSEYDWPDMVVCDNGPCYTSTEFRQTVYHMGIQHTTTHLTITKWSCSKVSPNLSEACCTRSKSQCEDLYFALMLY